MPPAAAARKEWLSQVHRIAALRELHVRVRVYVCALLERLKFS